jgi:small-conductance mechanosensitive channel/predicted  nucleic acid-binding Zn-ribbon protein
MRYLSIISAMSLIVLMGNESPAQVMPSDRERKPAQSQGPQSASSPPVEQKSEQISDAEIISSVDQLYEMDRRRLKQVQAELQKAANEYKDARKEFEQLNEALIEKKEQFKGGEIKPGAGSAQKEIGALERYWQLAKDRFDLVIQKQKILQAQTATIEEKIRLEKTALDRLTGAAEKNSMTIPPAAVQPAVPAAEREESVSTGLEAFGLPGAKPTSAQETQQTAATSRQPADSADQELPPEALLQAREDLGEKRAELKDAKERLQGIDRAIKVFENEIKIEEQLLEIARKQADNAEQTARALKEDMSDPSVLQATLAVLRRRSQGAESRWQEARVEVEQRSERAEALRAQLDRIKNARARIEAKYQEALAAVDFARQKVEWLESPLAPHRVYRWFIKSVPKILATLLLMGLFLWLLRVLGHRIVRAVASRSGPGSVEEREKRSETLVGVFNNGTTVTIAILGTLMLLQASGVNVTVLLGGAAVVGVAVAFGAQNLTRDYFSGFVMLLENQYGVNDIVKIGGIAGLVERITLRMTVLRDLEGVVHFIPHGEVTTVSNLTHGWSRALFDIGVAYKEDADHVMKVLMDLGKELRQDPYYGDLVLDDPEMLGVDSFGDSAVVIKFFIKTRPQRQFTIKREMLRRIKRKFDELGIEIPFPQRTVYYRSGDHSSVDRNGEIRN